MTDYEICNRCLVVVNHTSNVVARRPSGEVIYMSDPCSPRNLKKWVEDEWFGNNSVFETNAWYDTFKAVSTWHGDPVCVVHLHWLVQQEQNGKPVRF
jgi:hypothetical protein